MAVSIGLAGGLAAEARPGVVVIADRVAAGDQSWACDPVWSDALARAGASLGLPVLRGSLLTAGAMLTGAARHHAADRGFTAVDMESALLFELDVRVAAVRVVLDSGEREISSRWRHPGAALVDPRRWGEAWWLARHAPLFARRAAQVVARACEP